MKTIKEFSHQSFKKIRHRKNIKKNDIDELLDQRRTLKQSQSEKSKQDLKNIEEKLSDLVSEKNFQTIQDEMNKISDKDGKINSSNIWKVKSKLCPKVREPSMVKKD